MWSQQWRLQHLPRWLHRASAIAWKHSLAVAAVARHSWQAGNTHVRPRTCRSAAAPRSGICICSRHHAPQRNSADPHAGRAFSIPVLHKRTRMCTRTLCWFDLWGVSLSENILQQFYSARKLPQLNTSANRLFGSSGAWPKDDLNRAPAAIMEAAFALPGKRTEESPFGLLQEVPPGCVGASARHECMLPVLAVVGFEIQLQTYTMCRSFTSKAGRMGCWRSGSGSFFMESRSASYKGSTAVPNVLG
jgi:hypothetical protein